jgi:hypothetical protein
LEGVPRVTGFVFRRIETPKHVIHSLSYFGHNCPESYSEQMRHRTLPREERGKGVFNNSHFVIPFDEEILILVHLNRMI